MTSLIHITGLCRPLPKIRLGFHKWMYATPYYDSSFQFRQGTLQAFQLTDIITITSYSLGCAPSQGSNYTFEEKIMKLVKNLVLAVILVSALASKTFAGDIETPGY